MGRAAGGSRDVPTYRHERSPYRGELVDTRQGARTAHSTASDVGEHLEAEAGPPRVRWPRRLGRDGRVTSARPPAGDRCLRPGGAGWCDRGGSLLLGARAGGRSRSRVVRGPGPRWRRGGGGSSQDAATSAVEFGPQWDHHRSHPQALAVVEKIYGRSARHPGWTRLTFWALTREICRRRRRSDRALSRARICSRLARHSGEDMSPPR
jgi:hypothetical protein